MIYVPLGKCNEFLILLLSYEDKHMKLIELDLNESTDIKYVIAEYKKFVFVAFNKKYDFESDMGKTLFGMNMKSQCNDLFESIIIHWNE